MGPSKYAVNCNVRTSVSRARIARADTTVKATMTQNAIIMP